MEKVLMYTLLVMCLRINYICLDKDYVRPMSKKL